MKLTFLIILQYLISSGYGFYNQDQFPEVIVNTTNGLVRGKISKLFSENEFFTSFKGIPYAIPPLNQLRFKPPIASGKWSSILDANDFGNECMQSSSDGSKIIGNEDCLFLNIYTPNIALNANIPVMFFIHGGAHVSGSGNDDRYGADFLVNNSVILVTINYRLGPFGYLSLGTNEYSGNMALKDQQLALKWIYKNIHNFGGNKNMITIFGHSSGGACVELHMQSMESRKYFRKAIIMSGSMLSIRGFSSVKNHLSDMISLVGEITNHMNITYDMVTEFFKNVNAEEFYARSLTEHFVPVSPCNHYNVYWGPVVEDNRNSDAFLIRYPEKIIQENMKNNIDTMYGHTDKEALGKCQREIFNQELLDSYEMEFKFPFPRVGVKLDYESKEFRKMSNEVQQYYFNQTNQHFVLDKFIDLMSDILFSYNLDRSMKNQARFSTRNTFYYRFSVDGKLNSFKASENLTSIPGASHGDELCYLFKCNSLHKVYDQLNYDSIEMQLISLMSKLWTNFANYGNPQIEENENDSLWSMSDHKIAEITNKGLIVKENTNRDITKFWDYLYEQYIDSLH